MYSSFLVKRMASPGEQTGMKVGGLAAPPMLELCASIKRYCEFHCISFSL